MISGDLTSSIVMQEATKNPQKEVEEQLRSLKEELTKIKYNCSSSYMKSQLYYFLE